MHVANKQVVPQEVGTREAWEEQLMQGYTKGYWVFLVEVEGWSQ